MGYRAFRICALALLAVASAGCAKSRPASESSARVARLAWPPPPAQERVELREIFRQPSDLGIRASVWRRLGNWITGGREAHLVRPAGVAAREEWIAVADAGAAAVHVFDRARGRYARWTACGGAPLLQPVGVAILQDRVYVADAGARRVFVFGRAGDCQASWSPEGEWRPAGMAVDGERGRVYVADPGRHRILAFAPSGEVLLQFGRRGQGPGEFNFPTWVAVDREGRVYVTDSLNFRVQVFDAQGQPVAAFGKAGDGSGDFARPKGLGVDRDGHIYVVDALFDAVQVFDAEGRYLMVFGERGTGPGQFWLPSGLALDGDRIYVADSYNQRVQVFRYLGGSG